jgi:urease accessory protein UreF
VLWRLHPVIARVAREAAGRDPDAMWSFTPGLDIQGLLHAHLDTRLFRS